MVGGGADELVRSVVSALPVTSEVPVQRQAAQSEDAYRSRPYVSRDDVDPADAADQEAEVEVDDEDYR